MELQGHGHTADIDCPFSYQHFADDIAALIEHLKKGDMAREAERLLSGAGWLPEPLRLPVIEGDETEIAVLPDFLADDAEQADADDAFAIAAE